MVDAHTSASSGRWPDGARLVLLHRRSKQPRGEHGHLAAVAASDLAVLPDQNVGVVLDGMFALVDIDDPADPNAQAWMRAMHDLGTWHQTSPREKASPEARAANPVGFHWLVRLDPARAALAKNAKIVGVSGKNVGDVKVRGYVVAAGSTIRCIDGVERSYELIDGRRVVDAPEWLVSWLNVAANKNAGALTSEGGRPGIPTGEHDNFLASVGAFLRTRHGLSEEGIRKALAANADLLLDVDPRRPYTEQDYARIARSCVNLPQGISEQDPLLPATWSALSNIDLVQRPTEWWLRHFVPKGELVMLFGKGGAGKSSWASWLSAEVTRKGGSFLFVGVEEGFSRFGWRAVLSGADRERIFAPLHAGRIRLPRDIDKLQQAIELSKVDVIYFDSIMSHFELAGQGYNTAERSRLCLGPLAELAQSTGVTIVCVFHENKAGEYMGSTEMVNVGRYILRASRGKGPLRIAVTKTNLVKPGYTLAYEGRTVEKIDPNTGAKQYEVLDDGTLAVETVTIPHFIGKDAEDAEDFEEAPEELVADEQRQPGGQKRPKNNWTLDGIV